MSTALDKMMGRAEKQPHHMDGTATPKESAGNNAALSLLAKMIPGFNPGMIDKMGADVQQTVTWFKEHIENIEAQNRAILENQAGILAALAEKTDHDGSD